MILEAILLGSGAAVMSQVGTDLAKNLVPELLGGAIEHSMDGLLKRIRPERNQDFMRAVAAALQRATDDVLVGSKIVYEPDRKICQDLGRDAEELFVQKFGKPQKAVRDALLVGTVEDVSKALEGLIEPYVAKRNARAPHNLASKLALEFLDAFGEIVKDEKHEKGWKAFQRELAWAMHQQILALHTGQEEILAKLEEIYEGKIALPDIAQEFARQTEKMVTDLRHVISEDGDKTRQKLDDLATSMKHGLPPSKDRPRLQTYYNSMATPLLLGDSIEISFKDVVLITENIGSEAASLVLRHLQIAEKDGEIVLDYSEEEKGQKGHQIHPKQTIFIYLFDNMKKFSSIRDEIALFYDVECILNRDLVATLDVKYRSEDGIQQYAEDKFKLTFRWIRSDPDLPLDDIDVIFLSS